VIPFEWLGQAQKRIAPHIFETPLTFDAKRGLFIKWENHQITGSFKARGALNKVLSLEEWERGAGLVAASAGNHGQGVALAGNLIGAQVEVFVPAHAVPSKVEAMRQLGAQVRMVDGGYAQAEGAGRQYALEQGKIFISPYNDGQVIAGQGTMALEVLRQLRPSAGADGADIANWIVPIGGGGLISSCGAVLARGERQPRLIGVQAAASAFAFSLYHRHTQEGVEDNPTLADGLSGAVEEGSVTLPMIEKYVDDLVLVSEVEIGRAIAFSWQAYREKIEGSAAVVLAAVLEGKINERPSVVIISGGNIEPEVHEKIVRQYAGEQWN
jgi:threonine dehydratase